MNKKGESDALTYIIVMFVVLIIGLIFVSIIGNLTTAQTEKQTIKIGRASCRERV